MPSYNFIHFVWENIILYFKFIMKYRRWIRPNRDEISNLGYSGFVNQRVCKGISLVVLIRSQNSVEFYNILHICILHIFVVVIFS